ncbi:hypothetical protein TSUD_291040 [Trifolium subterraneum]|uniref:Integrase catalytic domain-containing protein n=1 Tax=Trifolium subterraneum TaxID=3900 RepID=A0A2Z6P3P6_TRISU|nr:hypothetical protein TSUD_291040 [Trifolium subterraneum]
MADNKDFGFPIPKFDGHYDHWSMLMENLLQSKEYWSIVEMGVPILAANATAEQTRIVNEARLKDLKAKNYLFQAIDRTIIETILDKSSSKAIWDSMKNKFQGSNKVKRAQLQALRGEFEILRMKEDESVNDYFGRVLALVNKMKMQGEAMEHSIVVEKILRSMARKFNYVVCAIEESNDVDTLSIDGLQGSLLVHEQKMKPAKEEDQALKITHGNGNTTRGRGRGGRTTQGRGKRLHKDNIECYKCHRFGHFQYECPNNEDYAHYADYNENEEVLLMAFDKPSPSSVKNKIWYLDSGCSNHMCGVNEFFFDLDTNFRETVRLGDNSQMNVMGKGNVKLQMNGITQIITAVYYIPELKNNLLSIGQLQKKDLTFVFKNNWCKVYHQNKGYGHLNYKSLKLLHQKNMVRDIPKIEDSKLVCEDFLIGKQHRDSIPKSSNWKSTKRLELIHSDLCGPISPASNSDNKYVLTFIDDFSRKTWVYFLKNKSSVFDCFKKFKCMVEKESSEVICCLRTDRGGEFNSDEFREFCEEHGIKRQLTAAYTPQQNGIAERKNRTIMDMVKSMLAAKDIPKEFWPEAVNWAIYVLNRSPTAAIPDKTPEEAWSSSKPTVKHFKVFGCIAHTYVPDAHRKKLDDKSIKCIFLGVSEESKAYRLYHPPTKRIIISRDVKFVEQEKWKWSQVSDPANTVSEDSDEELDERNNVGEEPINNHHEDTHDDTSSEIQVNEHTSTSSSANTGDSNSNLDQGTIRKPPSWPADYDTTMTEDEYIDEEAMNLIVFGPCIHEDPIKFEDAEKSQTWRAAMENEIDSIERNNTWELTDLPKGAKVIGVKWIYKTKLNEKGEIEKFKARLVAKGYAQKYGTDYKEVFVPVARWDTIRCLLAIAAMKGWDVYQLDVKSAFLHGELHETVYVEQPLGFIKRGSENKVYKLHKALYGLKQAPRAWNDDSDLLIISLYVDDLIFTGNNSVMVKGFKESMMKTFDMTDLGKMRFMEHPVETHMMAAKRILRYIRGTRELRVLYKRGNQTGLIAYSDSDFGGDVDDRKSTSGYLFMLGSGAVSWSSRKQPIVTLSTTEAEFIAAAHCVCQGIWLKRILESMGLKQQRCLDVFCDNSSTIKLSKNPVLHGRSKYIDIKFHFLRNLSCDGTIELEHCTSQNQIADIMTKALKLESFENLKKRLGVCSSSSMKE